MTALTDRLDAIEHWVWFYYDNCGFSVIPLGVNNADEPEKKPSLTKWDKYKTTRATREEIQQWIKDGLFKNIGIICGHVSGDLVIIDVDDETIPEICKINWSNILTSGAWPGRTGKGFQIWCKHHGNPGGIKKLLKYHIEYRANNGYCVAPPSIHPNGNIYSFIGVKDYSELPILIKKDAQQIFNEMKKKIGEAWNIEDKPKFTGTLKTDSVTEYPKCVEIALNSIAAKGMRYYTIYGIASAFYFKEIPIDMALQRIKRFNMEKCVPAHSSEIVEQAVKGAYQKDAHHYGCEFWMDDAGLCPYENIMECPHGKKKAKRELAREYKIFTYKEKENATGEKYYVKDGVIPPRLAELIMNEYDFHFFTMRDTTEMFYYLDGMYHNTGETIITNISEDYMEDLSTSHRKNEVVSHIQDFNYKEREEVAAPVNLINLKNGLLDINTFKLIPHSPDYFFVNQHPVKYDPDASYQTFEAFLKHISMKDGVVRQKVVDTIQEYMGYSLYRAYPLKNYIVLDGGGDNGKTVLMNVMLALAGEQNNTSIGLQELNERPFAKAQLYGKNTNISDDLPKKALKLTGIIKGITGNSPIWADVKNSKKGISFTPYAKPWYACNELPETNDYSDAFFSRQLQVTLLNKYLSTEDPKINNINIFERNVHLTEELTTEEMLSGILNFALIGLKRLLEKNVFSDDTTTEDKRTQWIRKTNPVVAYLDDECELGDENWAITVDDFYSELLSFCERNEFDKPTSRKYVTEKILDASLGIKKQQKTVNGTPHTWCWIGVKSVTNTLVNQYFGKMREGTII